MIKDKNIDPSANFPTQTVDLHTCGSGTAANTTTIDAWIAPWAGKIVKATMYMTSSTSATGTVDVWNSTAASATTGTSIFTAAYTAATTAALAADISSLLATTGGVKFAAGDILTLRTANAVITKPSVSLQVRPLLAKEIAGY
jgi:hypothetical protein